jgi:hypothetical protein
MENPEPAQAIAVVFRGSKSLCHEFSLVLEAKGIEHETRESERIWTLVVPVALQDRAYEEINRYSAERSPPRSIPAAIPARPGATLGAIVYVLILLLTAYCAGIGAFGADWLSIGDLDAAAPREWWRAVGASTAVFAALGLLAGMAWRERLTLRERLWYRWAPLIAGSCLLTLLGAGNAHVDVLGHVLGFILGIGVGWVHAQVGLPGNRGTRLQFLSGACAVLLVAAAWLLALSHGRDAYVFLF